MGDVVDDLLEETVPGEGHPLLSMAQETEGARRVPRSWSHHPDESFPSAHLKSAMTSMFTAAGIEPPKLNRVGRKSSVGNDTLKIVRLIANGIVFCFSWHAVFMVLVTVFAIFLCSRVVLNLRFDTSIPIVAYGTITPLTVTIGASFQSRDDALASLGRIKALVITLFMLVNFWDKSEDKIIGKELLPAIQKMVRSMEIHCRNKVAENDLVMSEASRRADDHVLDAVATLAETVHRRAPELGYAKGRGGEGGMQRAWECIRKILQQWELVKRCKFYPSPRGLRNFCFFMSHVAPVALAPYWLSFCAKEKGLDLEGIEVDPLYGCVSSYFVGISFTVVVVTLHRVRDGLENPFNESIDGVKWHRFHQQLACIERLQPDGPQVRFGD